MAALILPSRRVVQPQGPVEVDGGNPLVNSLGFSVSDFTGRDVVGQRFVTKTASLGYGVTNLGRGLSSAANAAFSAPLNLSSTNVVAVAFVFRLAAAGTQILVEHTANYGSNAGGFAAYIDAGNLEVGVSNGAGGFNVVRCAAPAVGRTVRVGIVVGNFANVNKCARIWYDGIEQATTQPLNGIISGNFANSTTYFLGRAATSLFANGVIHDLSLWLRGISDSEVAQWSANPWQLYRPIERRIWASVAGGGGGVTGSLAATEAGSDTFASSGAVLVAGSLSVTESGADTFVSTGTVTVAGSLNATESGADTFAATGSTTGGITGSLNATEAGTDTAALSGVVLVTGSINATESGADTFAASGVVVVTGLLSATEAGQDTFAAVGFGGAVTGSLNAQESGSDTFFATNVEQQTGGKGFEIVDMPSRQWWKRKPKAIPEQVAEQRVKRVVRAIQEVTQEQAAEPAKATQSAAQQQREVYEAIVPLLADMPGFDWKQVFRQIVEQDNARRQMQAAIARARFIEQDDEDVLLLMF